MISSVLLKYELEKIQKTTKMKGELPALCGHSEWSQGVYAGQGPGLRLHAYCYFGVRQSLGVQEIHCQCLLRKRLDAKAVSEISTYPMVKSISNMSLLLSALKHYFPKQWKDSPPQSTEGKGVCTPTYLFVSEEGVTINVAATNAVG